MTAESSPASISELIERDLGILEELEAYTALQVELVEPYLGRRILEIGAGTGNHTVLLAERQPDALVALEKEERFCATISQRCGSRVHVVQQDLAHLPGFVDELASWHLDTAIAINVIEHVENDVECLGAINAALAPGGRIVVLAPAHPLLFADLDHKYGHYRRYTRAMFRDYAERLHMRLVENRYFNMLGALGWLLVARIGHAQQMNRGSVRWFDRLVHIQQQIERRVPPPFGLGALAVLEKPVAR